MAPSKATPVTIREMAEALLAREDFRLRLLTQGWLRTRPGFGTLAPPDTKDSRILAAAASLIELLAERAGQPPPAWTATTGPLPEPFFVVAWADRPGFTRDLCLNESPEPLKRRNLFAPPDFLEMV